MNGQNLMSRNHLKNYVNFFIFFFTQVHDYINTNICLTLLNHLEFKKKKTTTIHFY